MKRIGLIGGMSYESTKDYYDIINKEVNKILGGSHSAEIYLYSFDYQVLDDFLHHGGMDQVSKKVSEAAIKLEQAGAEMILILANTIHLVAEDVKKQIHVPLVHIVESTQEAIHSLGMKKVGLLGTKFTMESNLYPSILEKSGIRVLIPSKEQRDFIHQTIYFELIVGKLLESSRKKFIDIIEDLTKQGCEGIILGCTEIPLLIKQEDVPVRIFNTTKIHALSAVKKAFEE
ncbi:MAG: aspartate/glutamate racemase family protein [Candidatus Izemoplasmatales bacterium]